MSDDTDTNLTETVLRQLYQEEGLSDYTIAKRFGLYQVKVGRLRKKLGIPNRAKEDRLALPTELTQRQRSILVGSMLGDGNLRPVGKTTARYIEHHSLKQRAYLDWKVAEWGPFFSAVSPSHKGEHRGFKLGTHASSVLHPFWEMFYPKRDGNKTFVQLPLEWVDDLALAVWFMDDGSRTSSYARFSVSPNKQDHVVLRKILSRFGIESTLYFEDSYSIHIQGRTAYSRFLDVIQGHIHPSMNSKVELKEPRKAGAAPRDVLTLEKVLPLVERGFSAQGIAGIFQVSRQSVGRALDRMGVPQRRTGRPAKGVCKELTIEAASMKLSQLNPELPSYRDDVLKVLSQTEIPLPHVTEEQLARDIELLRGAKTRLEGETLTGVSKGGSALCNHLFQHRFEARYHLSPSAKEAWYDPHYLKHAIRFQLAVGDPIQPNRVFRALQAVVRAPTNFRPCFAKAIAEAFSPLDGLVLDPCAGYGGRAAGVLAAGRSYVGVDPHPKAKASFEGLRKALGGNLEFHAEPFESVSLGGIQADLVFTSPPYFSVERYSDAVTQSWVRYATWDSWLAGFLQPLVSKSMGHLKPGGYFCINTKNVRMKSKEYPIVDELTQRALEAGFILESTLQLPLGRIGKTAQTEPLLVFRKAAR
jgi:hypothetical protein